MSDRLYSLSFDRLASWVFDELEHNGSVFGIPTAPESALRLTGPLTTSIHGHRVSCPFGVAAGPHTQVAPAIVASWLAGARVIELKTVQTLDRLEIPRPCIDMRDAGANVEWSHELTISESIDEYRSAWVLLHALQHALKQDETPGVLFDLSVGYDLEGIRRSNMRAFLEAMTRPAPAIHDMARTITRQYPELEGLQIPDVIAGSVTLSTMHGCPPDEIGRIATHLMESWGLHTAVKLNPTLLGPQRLRHILHDRHGWHDVAVPDEAFAHDLELDAALDLVRELESVARRTGVGFGLKLSNTLEVDHDGRVFGRDQQRMYLSGRPLHALTVNLAQLLREELGAELPISFAGGADVFSAPRLVACGMVSVTACSDLLRTGGTLRLRQWQTELEKKMIRHRVDSLEALVTAVDGGVGHDPKAAASRNLARYANEVLADHELHADAFDRQHTKTSRRLLSFDCISAPCVESCAVGQQVPRYMRAVRDDRMDEAAEVVWADNPIPTILGRACDHKCEPRCVRTHLDRPVAIREIKRFITEYGSAPRGTRRLDGPPVAVIGGGPCGLSAAVFLTRAGRRVTIFEAGDRLGGMVSGTIPGYRAAGHAVDRDLEWITSLGVEVRLGVQAGRDVTLADLRAGGFAEIIVAAGAQRGLRLQIPGEETPGVFDGLDLLRASRRGEPPDLGSTIAVIGGGDVAMDCARTAARLSGGRVMVVYRRTQAEMPAQKEEIDALGEEGIELLELLAPTRVVDKNGGLSGLECVRMELGSPDASGRRRPVPISESHHILAVDSVVVAIGQEPDLELFGDEPVERTGRGYLAVNPETFETSIPGVWAGGDVALDGPATIVRACADGRRIAAAIAGEGSPKTDVSTVSPDQACVSKLLERRAFREGRAEVPHLAPAGRSGFAEVVGTFDVETARKEAARCLDCDLMCSLCVTVCPNRAFLTYTVEPRTIDLPVLRRRGGLIEQDGCRPWTVRQPLQVAAIDELCNRCGNCTTFCPTADAPHIGKPRLYLTSEALFSDTDDGFLVRRGHDRWHIDARFGDELHHLEVGERVEYRGPVFEAVLDKDYLGLIEAHFTDGADEAHLDLEVCATMLVLLDGVRMSAGYLPLESI